MREGSGPPCPSSMAVSSAAARRRLDGGRFAQFTVRYGLFLALGLWMVAMTLASEHFLSWLNFLNVFRRRHQWWSWRSA